MNNFESLSNANKRETETSLNFQYSNLKMDVEALERRLETENDNSVRTAIEAQIRDKERKMGELQEKLRDFMENKSEGIGHA